MSRRRPRNALLLLALAFGFAACNDLSKFPPRKSHTSHSLSLKPGSWTMVRFGESNKTQKVRVQVTADDNVTVYVYLDSEVAQLEKQLKDGHERVNLFASKAIGSAENTKVALIEVEIPKRQIIGVFIRNMNRNGPNNFTATLDDI